MKIINSNSLNYMSNSSIRKLANRLFLQKIELINNLSMNINKNIKIKMKKIKKKNNRKKK